MLVPELDTMKSSDSPENRVLHVILACYNRRELTVRALRSLTEAASRGGLELDVTVFDDGSTDGTDVAVHELLPEATVLYGDGDAFWASSMAQAERAVLSKPGVRDSDVVLWLNDDVVLDADAIERMVWHLSAYPDAILVGATRDPVTGEMTYSGMKRAGCHPLRFAPLEPGSGIVAIDTFNGNIVAVPVTVARRLGGIDGEYSHALADIDYGLRCRQLGVEVLLMPGTLGVCPRNPDMPLRPVRVSWRRFTGPKGGGNFGSLTRYLRKAAPRTWYAWTAATYGVWWARALRQVVLPPGRGNDDSPAARSSGGATRG